MDDVGPKHTHVVMVDTIALIVNIKITTEPPSNAPNLLVILVMIIKSFDHLSLRTMDLQIQLDAKDGNNEILNEEEPTNMTSLNSRAE